jgi:hypothetical protein
MTKLHLYLTKLAFDLLQTGDVQAAEAAAWIQGKVRAERQRPRKRRRRKVRLAQGRGRSREFWIEERRLKDGEPRAE